MNSKSLEVIQFLDEINHPLRTVVETLRETILKVDSGLSENVKW